MTSDSIDKQNQLPSLELQGEVFSTLRSLRRRIVDQLLVLFGTMFPVGSLVLIPRALEYGLTVFNLAVPVILLVLAICALIRKRLPHWLKASLILGILFLLGVFGLFRFGLAAGGTLFLFTFSMLTSIIFGKRSGLLACGACVGTIAAFGLAIYSGALSFTIDFSIYATSVLAWVVVAAAFLVLVSMTVINMDSLHKEMENSIRESYRSKERLSLFLRHIPAITYIKDNEGKYSYCNEKFQTLLNLEHQDIIGASDTDLFPPDVAAQFQQNDDLVREQRKPVTFEESGMMGGFEREFLTVKFPIPLSEGDTPGVAGIGVDITEIQQDRREKRRLTEQLLQSQKVESLGLLSSSIAHDFNNLLQVIMINVEIAVDRGIEDKSLLKNVQSISKASKSGEELVQQLLDYGKSQKSDFRELDICSAIDEFMQLLRRLLGSEIEITHESTLHRIYSNRGQIEQILMNLCINARDAMDGAGVIKINTSTVEIDQAYCDSNPRAKPGHFVILSIRDTGAGMDKNTLEQIFEPFYTTKDADGTGLGLSTVLGIVNTHSGFIEVDSTPGEGTDLKIFLPLLSKDD